MNTGHFTSPNASHAKLFATDVQAIRDLYRAGFRSGSIAGAFNVCERTVRNIIKGSTWTHVPDVSADLPLLPITFVNRLRIVNARKLTTAQKQHLRQYRQRLELCQEQTAEREGIAMLKLSWWTARVEKAIGGKS